MHSVHLAQGSGDERGSMKFTTFLTGRYGSAGLAEIPKRFCLSPDIILRGRKYKLSFLDV